MAYLLFDLHEFNAFISPPRKLHVFKVIWGWKRSKRIKSLLWKIGKAILMTNHRHWEIGITTNPLCPICHVQRETIIHVLKDYFVSKRLW